MGGGWLTVAHSAWWGSDGHLGREGGGEGGERGRNVETVQG